MTIRLFAYIGLLVLVLGLWSQLGAQTPAADEPAAPATTAETTGEGGEDGEAASQGQAGDADAERTWGEALLLKLKQGGIVMVFLALVSVYGLTYAIERLVNLRRGAIIPDGLADEADRLWRNAQYDRLVNASGHSTFGRMLAVVAKHRDRSLSEVSTLAGDLAARDLRRHLQRAYPLAVVATIAPLLGLLGTVIGMIGAFDKVALVGELADPSVFGGDIGKALVTTGAGLSIAIPALALYHYFKARVQVIGIELEEQTTELLTEWFREEGAVTPTSPGGGGAPAAEHATPAAAAASEVSHAN